MEGKGERVGGGGEGGGVTRSAWYLFVFGPDRDMQLTRSEWCGTKVELNVSRLLYCTSTAEKRRKKSPDVTVKDAFRHTNTSHGLRPTAR